MQEQWDALWINGILATCEKEYGLLQNAAIAVKDGKISWIGTIDALPDKKENKAKKIYDLQNSLVTPGLLDCHTHLVFAGDRAHEFEWRLQGMSYEDITKKGGGIQTTVNNTRMATEASLFQQSMKRVKQLMNSGVTTLEIKSGYGLDLATELKILDVAKQIENILPITIIKTFLGAHVIPKEYQGNPDTYINIVCEEMIPVIAEKKLANAVDVFCETIAFNLKQTERIFQTAKEYGLKIKCHAEQLSNSGAAALAASYQALSVDHLEYLSLEGIKAIAKAGTVAVLLPGAFYFLREKQLPPIKLLRGHQVPIAIATDCNPGTSPILSLQLIMNMACTLFRFTPEEALLAVTIHAAKALGLEKTHGSLTVGKVADFAIWDVSHPAQLSYYAGGQLLRYLIRHGEIIEN